MPALTLTVNSKTHQVDVPEEVPLLWVLRDLLDFTGTKFGCGVGNCGSCTVHVDGNAYRSCQITPDWCKGKKITTIEGLSEDGSHPMQKAWMELNVPQCGYCQAGQIMTAAHLLQQFPHPTDSQSSIWLSVG